MPILALIFVYNTTFMKIYLAFSKADFKIAWYGKT